MAKEILGGNSKKFDEDIAKEDCQKNDILSKDNVK